LRTKELQFRRNCGFRCFGRLERFVCYAKADELNENHELNSCTTFECGNEIRMANADRFVSGYDAKLTNGTIVYENINMTFCVAIHGGCIAMKTFAAGVVFRAMTVTKSIGTSAFEAMDPGRPERYEYSNFLSNLLYANGTSAVIWGDVHGWHHHKLLFSW
jgi:hypothetical protein